MREKLLDALVRRIIIPLFSRLLARLFFFSFFFPFLVSLYLRNSRGSLRSPADGDPRSNPSQIWIIKFGQRFTPRRCTRASAYVPCNKATECRRTPCNQVQSRRLLIYTSGLVKAVQWEGAPQWGPSTKIINTVYDPAHKFSPRGPKLWRGITFVRFIYALHMSSKTRLLK